MNAENDVVEINPGMNETVDVGADGAKKNLTAKSYSTPPESLSPEDERMWAMLAHLSVLVNLFTGFLGVAIPLIIYLVYKDRSRYVRYQAFQAFMFQLIVWVGGMFLLGLVWLLVAMLIFVLIGILLLPFALFLSLIIFVPFIYGIVAAIQTSKGEDFRYWLVGDWSLGLM